MAIRKRILKVTLSMPSGDVVLNQEMQLSVRASKAALAIQNKAVIEVYGLTTQLRETLLSQFTAWNKRKVDTGQIAQNYVNVKIEAGYSQNGIESTGTVFIGQVTLCEPSSPPPNIGVRITCFSRQIDKTAFLTSQAPARTTFGGYVQWAANEMGFGNNFVCDTSYNDVVIENPARSILTRAALLIDIQNMYRPNVAAFIDDDRLIVKDRDKIINVTTQTNAKEFIGIPMWNEWGVDLTVMYDPGIKLAQAVYAESIMNPSINGTYVMMELDYDLHSRDRPFYVRIGASPPA